MTLTSSEASGFPDSPAEWELKRSEKSLLEGAGTARYRLSPSKLRLCSPIQSCCHWLYPRLAFPSPCRYRCSADLATKPLRQRNVLLFFLIPHASIQISQLSSQQAPGDPQIPTRSKERTKISPACLHKQLRPVHRPGEREGTSSRPRRDAAGGRTLPREAARQLGALRRWGRVPSLLAAQRYEQIREQPQTRSPPRSPRRVTHQRAGARGSSSAPALRRPERRRGRETPWAAATGPHGARRRQPQRSAGRGGGGRQGRARSAGSGGPYSMCPVSAPRRGAEWQMRDPITSHVTGKHRDQHPNLLRRRTAELLVLRWSPTSLVAGARFGGSAGAPRSPPRRQGRPAVSKAAAQRCAPSPLPGPQLLRPSRDWRLALLAPLCPLAPVHPLSPRRRPARARQLRGLAALPAPRSRSASPGSRACCLLADGSAQVQRVSQPRGQGGGDGTRERFKLHTVPRSARPRTAAPRGRGGAAGARQKAVPAQRLSAGRGLQGLRGRRGASAARCDLRRHPKRWRGTSRPNRSRCSVEPYRCGPGKSRAGAATRRTQARTAETGTLPASPPAGRSWRRGGRACRRQGGRSTGRDRRAGAHAQRGTQAPAHPQKFGRAGGRKETHIYPQRYRQAKRQTGERAAPNRPWNREKRSSAAVRVRALRVRRGNG